MECDRANMSGKRKTLSCLFGAGQECCNAKIETYASRIKGKCFEKEI